MFQQVRGVLYGMWRKRWAGLATLWAVCALGWVFVSTIPNTYQSTARVYVKYNNLLPTVTGVQQKGSGRQQQVEVVRQTLTSRPNLEKVLRRSNPDLSGLDGGALDGVIADMTGNIQIAPQGNENIYAVNYTANETNLSNKERAAFAQRVVQNLIDIFVEDNVASDRDSLNEASRFLDTQIAERERALEETETKRAGFEQKYFGQLPGTGDITQRVSQTRSELDKAQQELIQAQGSLRSLQAQMGSTPASLAAQIGGPRAGGGRRAVAVGSADPGTTRGKIEIIDKQIADGLSRGYKEAHPDIVMARAQIARLRDQLAREPKTADGTTASEAAAAQANPVYVNLRSLLFDKQSQVAALQARVGQLGAALSGFEAKQQAAPQVVAEQAKLARDYDVLKSGYDNLLRSREQIRLRGDIASQTKEIEFRTIDPPTLPDTPIAPNRALLLSLVLAAGLALGLAAAFVTSQLKPAYISEERLAIDTALPVLGSIGEVVSPVRRARERRLGFTFAVGAAAAVGVYALLLAVTMLRGGTA